MYLNIYNFKVLIPLVIIFFPLFLQHFVSILHNFPFVLSCIYYAHISLRPKDIRASVDTTCACSACVCLCEAQNMLMPFRITERSILWLSALSSTQNEITI